MAEEGDVVDVLVARLDEITTELLRRARGDLSWFERFIGLRVRLDIVLHRRDRQPSAVSAVCRELGDLLVSGEEKSAGFGEHYSKQRTTSARLRALHDDAVAACRVLAPSQALTLDRSNGRAP